MINEAIAAQIPYFGICLGLQLGVKAQGGKVIKSSIKEVGWRDAQNNFFTLELIHQDFLFDHLKFPLRIFQLHGETVELTNGMELLATGKHCKNQIVKISNNAYGIREHKIDAFYFCQRMMQRFISI